MAESRWMFTKEQLMNTPSRKNGIDADKELSYRQQAANLIQDMGQRLSVSQLCINTAIVYMHRFYMFQSFTRFPRNEMAPACLFLAAKLEEQPRKLEHVIKVAHSCLHRDNTPAPDPKTEAYLEQAQTLVINENILLQTLGFEVSVDHPHSHVVKATHLVKASKDLAQTSYFLATNSLHLTTLCLQYRPTIVACVCIHLACKWSNWKIPRSNEGKEWYQYVDRSVTQELLEELYNEFLSVLEKCPHKLRKKIMGWKGGVPEGETGNVNDQNKNPNFDCSMSRDQLRQSSSSTSSSSHYKHTNHDRKESRDPHKHSQSDQKPSQEHHRSRDEQRKEWHQDRKDSHPGSDKKPVPSGDRRDHPDRDYNRKEGGSDRRDGHHERKEGHMSHSSHSRNEPSSHGDHKDRPDSKHAHPDRKDLPHIKKEPNVNERSHGAPPPSHAGKISESVSANVEVKKEPVDTPSQSQAQISSELRKTKSETALHYKEYLRRKEAEKHEKERLEKEKYLKQKAEAEQLNKTFTEGSNREHEHRPPKLDMSLTSHSNETATNGQGRSVNADRPYEVNIKSPIKPHHNITVKSPIKSSDLKQPKLEITKVQLTPEKDGSSSVSVNINSDPHLKKMVGSAKQEASNAVNSDRTDSGKVRVKQEPGETKNKHELKMKIKQNPGEKTRVKQESENLDSDIKLRPEHSAAPNFKIRELNYNPDSVLDSAVSLKMSIKQEGNSGRVTPVASRDPSSGTSTPVSVKPSTAENSPLKIKISTKGIHNDSDASSGKHGSPHRHHKHKDKHKHKRSKDKHKEKHRDKHSSSSSSSVAPAGTNGQSLKLSFKLSDIQAHSSSSNDSWSVKHKHDKYGQKASISDTALNRNNNANSQESERQQPWSMSDLISKSSHENSPSRKRRRGSNVEQSQDAANQPKAAKTEPHRLRRSSSSHSVVSMDMSDGDEDGGTEIQTLNQPKGVVNQLHESLQAAIAQTSLNVMQLQQAAKMRHDGISKTRTHDRRPQIDRQQSGFDLEGMMWSGGAGDAPPLPHGAPPPLPTSTPPPPPH